MPLSKKMVENMLKVRAAELLLWTRSKTGTQVEQFKKRAAADLFFCLKFMNFFPDIAMCRDAFLSKSEIWNEEIKFWDDKIGSQMASKVWKARLLGEKSESTNLAKFDIALLEDRVVADEAHVHATEFSLGVSVLPAVQLIDFMRRNSHCELFFCGLHRHRHNQYLLLTREGGLSGISMGAFIPEIGYFKTQPLSDGMASDKFAEIMQTIFMRYLNYPLIKNYDIFPISSGIGLVEDTGADSLSSTPDPGNP